MCTFHQVSAVSAYISYVSKLSLAGDDDNVRIFGI